MLDEKLPRNEDDETIDIGYQPVKPISLLSDITGFISLVQSCFEKINRVHKRNRIKRLFTEWNWHVHYRDKTTGRCVLSEIPAIEHIHELKTAILLSKAGYDVIFAPTGMFARHQKRFDIFLLKDTIILKADLKYISSKLPDTIASRIIDGSQQASHIVLDINSDIEKNNLIDGIRSGVIGNKLVTSVLLLYKGRFYILSKDLIHSKSLYTAIK